MAESRSPHKAPRISSGTMRLATVSGKDRAWLRTGALVVAVALGGAAIGSLGSQLLARLTLQSSGAGSANKAPLLLKSQSPSGRLAEIDQALLEHDASTALILCDEALRGSPGDPQLTARRKRAETEQLDRFRLEMLEQAISRRNHSATIALAEEISASSPQRAKADGRVQTVMASYVSDLLGEADRAAKLSLCSEARALLSHVLKLQPQNSRAQEILSACPTSATGAPAGGHSASGASGG
jgi:hypothetical protein